MDEDIKERRCKSCEKLLLDEKLPFCKRCALAGRNKAGQIGGIIIALAPPILSVVARVNNDSDKNEPD